MAVSVHIGELVWVSMIGLLVSSTGFLHFFAFCRVPLCFSGIPVLVWLLSPELALSSGVRFVCL